MASLLLKLGAVSSQAESSGVTVFHRYVCSQRFDLVKILLQDDKASIKSAINHMVFEGSWQPQAIAPIQSAIDLRNTALVLTLLQAGAAPSIDFDTWFKSAKASPNYHNTDNLRLNEEAFSRFRQPIIAAVRAGRVDLVKSLLDRGVNPNTMTVNLGKPIPKDYHSYNRVESCLDLCRTLMTNINNEMPGTTKSPETEVGAGADEFLNKLSPGSYLHFTVKKDIDSKMLTFTKRENDSVDKTRTANAAKKEALDELLGELKQMEQLLIVAGAKTIEELEPAYKSENSRTYDHWYMHNHSYKTSTYEYTSSFSTDEDMSTTRRDGYVEL